MIDASATGAAPIGSITVQSPVTWLSSNYLSLIANDSSSSFITFLANVTAPNGSLCALSPLVNVGDSAGNLTTAVAVSVETVTINANTGFSNFLGIYGSNNTGASAQVSGNTIALNINGDVVVQGGSGGSAYAAVTPTGTMSSSENLFGNITGNLYMNAGNAVACSAAIIGTNASITIGASTMTPAASVTLTASNTASYSNAIIATNNIGYIQINTSGDVILNAGSMPGCNADIATYGSGFNDGHITINTAMGDVVLNGGF